MSSKRLTAALVVAVLLLAAWPSQAVIIDVVKNEPADIYGTFSFSAPGPIEDGVLEVDVTKYFLENPFGLLPMVLEFHVTPEQGDTLTRIGLHEEVHNQTGIDWTDFELFLVNLPEGMPQFAGAFFNNDAPPTSDAFGPPTSAGDASLAFDGGVVPDTGQDIFNGIRIEFTETLTEGNTYIFRLKELPTPEPASLILLGVLAMPVLVRRRQK
jgi:hypothetical protein